MIVVGEHENWNEREPKNNSAAIKILPRVD